MIDEKTYFNISQEKYLTFGLDNTTNNDIVDKIEILWILEKNSILIYSDYICKNDAVLYLDDKESLTEDFECKLLIDINDPLFNKNHLLKDNLKNILELLNPRKIFLENEKLFDFDLNKNYINKILKIEDIGNYELGKVSIDESLVVYLYFDLFDNFQQKVMFDVGAFSGTSFKYFLNDKWKIHIFEPDIDFFKNLKKKFNQFEHLLIFNNLAVDKNSNNKVKIYKSGLSKGITSMHPFHSSHYDSGYKINTINLSDYKDNHNIHKIDFLKIDVEGNDFNVLLGNSWNEDLPHVILIEFELNKTKSLGYTPDDVAKFLISKNYSVYVFEWYPIVEYGGEHSFKTIYKYEENIIPENSWGNFIAFQKDPGLKLLNKLKNRSLVYYEPSKHSKKNIESRFKRRIKKLIPYKIKKTKFFNYLKNKYRKYL